MLTEIRMDSVASFKKEAKLVTDKKINLIYGLNGTGKSTISNFLYEPSNARFIQCTKLPALSDPILVYNQSFIQDNFYVADRLKGIFSLSKENKLAAEKIENATAKLNQLEQSQKDNKNKKQEVTGDFETQKQKAVDEVWKIKSTFTGGDRVLEYCLDGLKGKKETLFEHLVSIAKPGSQPEKSLQAIREEVEALKGESAQSQSSIPLLQYTADEIESNSIFEEPIIGNLDSQVAKLIETLGNADWVKQGLGYVPEPIDKLGQPCPFCQEKTITSALADRIKDYFDDSYQEKINSLEKMRAEYIEYQAGILDISSYTDHPFSVEHVAMLTKRHSDLVNLIRENVTFVEKKIKNPKFSQALKSTAKAVEAFNEEVREINLDINVYNEKLKNRESTLRELKNEFWSNMRWQYDQTIARFDSDRVAANKKLDELRKESREIESNLSSIKTEIASAQKETVNVDEAVDAINKCLVEFGIDGFNIKKHSESLYRIVRVGQSEDAFRTLSEGEKMMISFLYFCELCKGKASASDTQSKRIAVIDDPISSLSHVFIFNVGQLIRSVFFRSDRISQIFVLTHSLYFFYELTDPNHERRKENQKLFRIIKNSSGSDIQEMKYEEVQNDYQSYWSVINDSTQPPALIANCMRNIVEYFFNFVRKKDLNNVFLMPQLQEVKYQAFCRYINRESHSLGQNIIDMKEFDYSIFKEGLRLVFKETGYEDHFKAMSKM
ncbi:MAG: AAA family ATPase [Pseudomonadota bacterium]|nr:AAA family ATPase [Pseudomonadota bacterium]